MINIIHMVPDKRGFNALVNILVGKKIQRAFSVL